jgi:RNA polymerase sigma factor (sigma-70 family)
MPTQIPQEAVPSAVLSWQPEDTVVEAAQNGDSAALDSLIRLHQQGVRLQCLRRGLNQDDANDVTQDVFVKVVRNISRYRHDTAFQTWLYRVTENAIFDHFRSRGRYQAKHEPMPVDGQDRPVEPASPERSWEKN